MSWGGGGGPWNPSKAEIYAAVVGGYLLILFWVVGIVWFGYAITSAVIKGLL